MKGVLVGEQALKLVALESPTDMQAVCIFRRACKQRVRAKMMKW